MARDLRIQIPGGRYHITARGNERRAIFRQDTDRIRLLELFSELPGRFGVRLHAYVLMNNHYHLVMETPEANLSRATQWLNVSYSVWFNRRHRRSGHLFQGRFKAILIEENAGLQRVARYVHLNPVRLMGLGLGKGRRQAVAKGLAGAPRAEVVGQRMEVLRKYRWSSYGALAGYRPAPDWVWLQDLRGLSGGRGEVEQSKAVRQYTEDAVREGLADNPWEGLVGGVVLGSAEFARRLLKGQRTNQREQPSVTRTLGRASWKQIVQAVEKAKGEQWETFSQRHGDWGREAALWLGRYSGRMRLAELAVLVGGCDYTTVGKAVSRFQIRASRDPVLGRRLQALKHELSCFEM